MMLAPVYWLLDLCFRREVIGLRGEAPYLNRWVIYRRVTGEGLYIHHFVGDDTADIHDHPKTFTSIGLWGGYVEEVITPRDHRWVHHRAPWKRTFLAQHRHRIVLDPGRTCWTIVKTGPFERPWGFYTRDGWIPWEFYEPGRDLRRDGCSPE